MVVLAAVESLFVRPEPRRTVGAYLLGLLSAVERKNCWWLAEHAGHARPDAMQRLRTSAQWDADAARDQVRRDVVDQLGPAGVLIFDETGSAQERRLLGRGAAPVHRHRRPDRKQPGRGVRDLRHRPGP